MRGIACLITFVLLLVGCGGEAPPMVSPTATSEQPTATPATSATPIPAVTATAPPSTATRPAATETPRPTATPPPPTPTPAISQGVFGLATIGPQCPVQRQDIPCPDQAWEGVIVARTLAGAEVARTASNAEGRFNLLLAPGDYVLVTITGGGILPHPAEVRVSVPAGRVVYVELMLDTGIR